MRSFVKRVAQKISKLTPEQVENLLDLIADENEILGAVIESLSTGLLLCDKHWNIWQMNKAAERFLPLKQRPAEQWNKTKTIYESRPGECPIWSIIEDADIANFLKETSDHQKNNVSEEFTVTNSFGAERIMIVSTMPLVLSKKVIGTIITLDDVTETRQQEVLLRRMESLASLTSLAASVAHEIKNPLGSISIHIQLIQKAFAKSRAEDGKMPDKKYAEQYLEVINEEIERLNQTIVDFLFAVRPIKAHLELLNPNVLIYTLTDFFQPELESKHITLKRDLLEKAPNILLDSSLFKQVITNLIQNAMAAMPSGGLLWISTMIKNERFIINVADNGIGMDSETLSRVFEPYFTTKATGTGLGLTMVYKIIKELSGEITVQSFPSEGTIFIMSFPIPQKERRLLEYQTKDTTHSIQQDAT